jgi:hypothetical protein
MRTHTRHPGRKKMEGYSFERIFRVFLLLSLWLFACSRSFSQLYVGNTFPSLELIDRTGSKVELKSHTEGRPVLVFITWRQFAKNGWQLFSGAGEGQEGDRVRKWKVDYKLKTILINAERFTLQYWLETQTFWKYYHGPFEVFWDPLLEDRRSYINTHIVQLPTTALLDSEFKILYTSVGMPSGDYYNDIEKCLSKLNVTPGVMIR